MGEARTRRLWVSVEGREGEGRGCARGERAEGRGRLKGERESEGGTVKGNRGRLSFLHAHFRSDIRLLTDTRTCG